MDLREKIEATLRQWIKPDVFVSEDNLTPVAAAILAIPEIRDALELSPAIIANRDDTIRDMALEIAELRIKFEPSAQP